MMKTYRGRIYASNQRSRGIRIPLRTDDGYGEHAGNLGATLLQRSIPGNPYVKSCSLPGPSPKVRGLAPDANAIIACRNQPGCLSWYINGP